MSIYIIYSAHKHPHPSGTRLILHCSARFPIHVSTRPIASFVSIRAVSHCQSRCGPKSAPETGVVAGVDPSHLRAQPKVDFA